MMKMVEKMVWGRGVWGGGPRMGCQRTEYSTVSLQTEVHSVLGRGYWEERHQPLARGLRTALSTRAGRWRHPSKPALPALPASGGWEFLQGVCCSLPPGAQCLCTGAALCTLTLVLVTLQISVNDWSAARQFWAHPCFVRALLRRPASLGWRWGGLPAFLLFFLLFFFFSPFQHQRRESTKETGCAVTL